MSLESMQHIEKFLSVDNEIQHLATQEQIHRLSQTLFYHTFQNGGFEYKPPATFFGMNGIFTLEKGKALGSGTQAVFLIYPEEQSILLRGFQGHELSPADLVRDQVFAIGSEINEQNREEALKWFKLMKSLKPDVIGDFADIRCLPSKYCLGLIEVKRQAIDFAGHIELSVRATDSYQNDIVDLQHLVAGMVFAESLERGV